MTQAGAAATLALGLSIAFASAGWAADQDLKGFDCIIEPNQMVELGSPVPGVIDEMLVDRGDKVAKGQLVARLKSDLEQAAVNLAQAQANYNAEVASAKAQHDFAARKADRTEELFAKKGRSIPRQGRGRHRAGVGGHGAAAGSSEPSYRPTAVGACRTEPALTLDDQPNRRRRHGTAYVPR